MSLKYKHSAYTLADWTEINPIIVENEIVIEKGIDGAKDKLKRGNGVDHYLDLPYLTGDEFDTILVLSSEGIITELYLADDYIYNFDSQIAESVIEYALTHDQIPIRIRKTDGSGGFYEFIELHDFTYENNHNSGDVLHLPNVIYDEGIEFPIGFYLEYVENIYFQSINKIKQESILELPEQLEYIEQNITRIDEELTLKVDEPEHIFQIKYNDVQWDGNWILITLSESISNKDIEDVSFLMSIGNGLVKLNAQIRYPSALTNSGQPIYGFYIRDINNQITRLTAFDYILLKFNIVASTTWKYDGRKLVYGKNVINNHYIGDANHSTHVNNTFLAVYPSFTGNLIESRVDLGNVVTKEYQQEYFDAKEADMLMFPYVSGALTQDVGSNPNTLEVGSHYSNSYVRNNITNASNKFLFNTIAVGARPDNVPISSETDVYYIPKLNSLSWIKIGWTGNYTDGFTHTVGEITPLSRFFDIYYGGTNPTRKYKVSITIATRTAGSVIVNAGGFISNSLTETVEYEIISNANSQSNKAVIITPTSDFDGKVIVRISSIAQPTSYGYGMEFFEDFNTWIGLYPLPNLWLYFAQVFTYDTEGLFTQYGSGTILYSTANREWGGLFDINDKIKFDDGIELTVTEIIADNAIRIQEVITPILKNDATNPYPLRLEIHYSVSLIWGISHQQSPVTAVVAAKLKNIQQETNVSWQLIREAARATAKKTVGGSYLAGQTWDMYRGFGQIQVDDAIQYIKDNYTENATFKADLADKIEAENQKYSLLEFEDLGDMTPVPKKFIQALIDRIEALETT